MPYTPNPPVPAGVGYVYDVFDRPDVVAALFDDVGSASVSPEAGGCLGVPWLTYGTPFYPSGGTDHADLVVLIGGQLLGDQLTPGNAALDGTRGDTGGPVSALLATAVASANQTIALDFAAGADAGGPHLNLGMLFGVFSAVNPQAGWLCTTFHSVTASFVEAFGTGSGIVPQVEVWEHTLSGSGLFVRRYEAIYTPNSGPGLFPPNLQGLDSYDTVEIGNGPLVKVDQGTMVVAVQDGVLTASINDVVLFGGPQTPAGNGPSAGFVGAVIPTGEGPGTPAQNSRVTRFQAFPFQCPGGGGGGSLARPWATIIG